MAASTEVQDVRQLPRTFRLLSSVWPRKTEGGVIGGFREHYRISVTSSLVPQLRTFSNAMVSSQYQSEAAKRLGRSFSPDTGIRLLRRISSPWRCGPVPVDTARADRRHRQFSEWIVDGSDRTQSHRCR